MSASRLARSKEDCRLFDWPIGVFEFLAELGRRLGSRLPGFSGVFGVAFQLAEAIDTFRQAFHVVERTPVAVGEAGKTLLGRTGVEADTDLQQVVGHGQKSGMKKQCRSKRGVGVVPDAGMAALDEQQRGLFQSSQGDGGSDWTSGISAAIVRARCSASPAAQKNPAVDLPGGFHEQAQLRGLQGIHVGDCQVGHARQVVEAETSSNRASVTRSGVDSRVSSLSHTRISPTGQFAYCGGSAFAKIKTFGGGDHTKAYRKYSRFAGRTRFVLEQLAFEFELAEIVPRRSG